MKRIVSVILLICILLYPLYGCASKTSNNKCIKTKEFSIVKDFGIIRGLVCIQDQIIIASSSKLGIINYYDNSFEQLCFDPLMDDDTIIYNIASFGNGLYYVVGELPPSYTHNGILLTNPSFSGNYCVYYYEKNSQPEKIFEFQLGKNSIISGLRIADNHLACWSDNSVWFFDLATGKMLKEYTVQGTIMSLVENSNGMWLHVEVGEKHILYELHISEKTINENQESVMTPVTYASTYSNNNQLILAGETSVYSYDLDQGKSTLLFNWSDCMLSNHIITNVIQLDDRRMVCASQQEDKIWIIEQQDTADIRIELHLATVIHSPFLDYLVNDFNQNSTEYRILIDEYSPDAYDRLCTEIIGGDGPDIIDLSSLSMPRISCFFENLYPFIDSDPELTREDFIPTILRSAETNGKLNSLPATFSVVTITAKEEDVGDKERWSFSEMMDTLNKKGEGYHLFPRFLDRDEFLKLIAYISSGGFIDWDARKAYFDSDDFMQFLSYCNELEIHDMATGTFETRECWQDYEEWPHLLDVEYLQTFLRVGTIRKNYGKSFSFIGFPCSKGNGSFLACEEFQFAISINSQHKNGAWSFIRTAYLPAFQNYLLIEDAYFPVRTDSFYQGTKNAVDSINCFTDVEQNKLETLVEEPHRFLCDDQEITEIIKNEAEAYFDGKQTLEKTSSQIQNRVTLYLAEK